MHFLIISYSTINKYLYAISSLIFTNYTETNLLIKNTNNTITTQKYPTPTSSSEFK